MEHEILIENLGSLGSAARRFISEIGESRIVAFHAPMGAGKTTFISAVCRELGVNSDAISSPTFSIVNEYRTVAGDSVFHFDFYRITRNDEALDIGFYDYVDSGSLCLIEWPENISDLLPDDTVLVTISVNPDGSRLVSW